MKLACSSTAFDERFRSGDLTQLEWVDLCAHEFAADGAVFDERHFPRTDTDYLAQLKKLATDAGVTVAALRHDALFSAEAAVVQRSIEIALAIGAPVLSAPLPPEVAMPWTELQDRLGQACSLAKRYNVTIAVRNAPHTYASGDLDLKRVAKEADSAWLRFGPDLAAFEAADDRQAVLSRSVIAFAPYDAAPEPLAAGFRGFIALDAPQGDAAPEKMKNALRAWRNAFREADRT